MTDTFLGMHISMGTTGSMTLALVLAVLLGGLIGLERELHGHPAGLRTHILVCLGSTLITIISVHAATSLPGSRSDPGRIAAQIVSGIGFLGAGAILREGATIRGLTTAASIWATAGIGMALGIRPAFGELALISTGIVLFTLWFLHVLEERIARIGPRIRLLEVRVRDTERAASGAIAQVASQGVEILSVRHERSAEAHTRHISMRVRLPGKFDRARFIGNLAEQPDVVGVDLEQD